MRRIQLLGWMCHFGFLVGSLVGTGVVEVGVVEPAIEATSLFSPTSKRLKVKKRE